MTELFLQNFIIKESDILLLVVGKLTYSEQLLVNKIKEQSKKQNKGRILIIHNLQELRTKEQIQDYIDNYLFKYSTFDLIKRARISTEKDNEPNKIINKINQDNENNFFLLNDENGKNEEAQNQNINNEINNQKKKFIENKNFIHEGIDENNQNKDILLNDIHFTEILKYDEKNY